MEKIIMVIKYEFYKLLKMKYPVLIVLGLYIVMCCIVVSYKTDYMDVLFDVKLYEQYVNEYGGDYSENTYMLLNQQLEKQQQIADEMPKDSMTYEEAYSFDLRITAAKEKIKVLNAILTKYDSLKLGQQLIYDLDVNKYQNSTEKKFVTMIMVIIVIIVSTNILFVDRYCQMEEVLAVTYTGATSLRIAKSILVLFINMMIVIISYITEILLLKFKINIGDGNAIIQSYECYSGATLSHTMNEAFVYALLFKISGVILISILLVVTSNCFKSDIISIVISIVVFAFIDYVLLNYIDASGVLSSCFGGFDVYTIYNR